MTDFQRIVPTLGCAFFFHFLLNDFNISHQHTHDLLNPLYESEAKQGGTCRLSAYKHTAQS